jgi:hypothetical protein
MARLPDLDNLGARPVPRARMGIASVDNPSAIGDAVEGFGKEAARVGANMLEDQDRFEYATAHSEFITKKVQLDSQADADEDYKTLGKRYGESVQSARDTVAQKIQSKSARAAFMLDTAPDVARGEAGVQQKIVAKTRLANRGTLDATIKNNGDAALAASDPVDSVRLIESSATAIQAAELAGDITPEEAVAMRTTATEHYGEERVKLFPLEKQVELLSASLKSEKTGSFLDYLPIDKRKDLLDEAKSKIRTEERARRADERLAIEDRVDGAEEVARLIDDNIPVPAASIDEAITVAKTAGKDALAYRLGVGKVKARLSFEHKADTPAEMQDDINALSAKITKASDHPKPEDVIARDHLVSLRDKATTALSNDPLSWAAGAWAIDIPPLDWDDPAKLGRRLQVARTVSKRTGAALSPLTDEEASALKVEMDHGPSGQVGVLDRIRKFGPQGAVAVARQIAPDNDGFRVAAGLVTLPNASLARDAARDAIIGGDALKATPDIFKEPIARSSFADRAAPAMKLLPPEMRSGVYAAAKNIYAARRSRSGATDWDGDEWNAAVDAAMGGSGSGDSKRGGIGEWRGVPTVLPYGWTQDQLETTISRADDAKLWIAGHGAPVWSNGQPVRAEALKKMKMVAVGDGVYQFSDGNGFVSKSGGGPFQINVRELRK